MPLLYQRAHLVWLGGCWSRDPQLSETVDDSSPPVTRVAASNSIRASQQEKLQTYFQSDFLHILQPCVMSSARVIPSISGKWPRALVIACVVLVLSGGYLANNSQRGIPSLAVGFLLNNPWLPGTALSTHKCISIQAPYFISFLSRSTIIRYSYCFWILLVLIDPFHAILSWISTYSSHLKLSTHSTSTIDFYVMCSTTQPHKHCFTFLLYFPVIHKHSFSYMCTSMKVRIFIKPCYSTPEMFPQDSASYHSDISKSICKFIDSVLTIPKKSA